MTTPRECTHGMPSPASCTLCMDDGPVGDPPPPEPETVEITITARFDGACNECSLPISAGQMVHRIAPSGRYVHAFCWTRS